MPELNGLLWWRKIWPCPIPMTLVFFASTLLTIALIFITITQPLLFGLIIIISVSLIATIVALTLSSWYAYTIFIIFVGGLLVIFAYVSALIPNDLFFPPRFFYFFQIFTILTSLILLSFKTLAPSLAPLRLTLWNSSLKTASNLYFYSNYTLLLLLILVLLFILTLVVKICNVQLGPLRPFNYLFSINVHLSSKQKV